MTDGMATEWGAQVNEVGIFATGLAAEWWAEALAPWEISGHAQPLALTPAGGVWYLPGGEKDDAQWMCDHITSHGVPAKFVKLTTAQRAAAWREAHQMPQAGAPADREAEAG